MKKPTHGQFSWTLLALGGIFITYGLLVLILIFLPYQKSDSFESGLLDVIEVKTSIYQKNVSQEYPIGALEFGEQRILLLNKSNENIEAFFILKVKNMAEYNLLINVGSETKETLEFTLAEVAKEELKIPFELSSHGTAFIDVLVHPEFVPKQELLQFPVSVISWSFKRE